MTEDNRRSGAPSVLVANLSAPEIARVGIRLEQVGALYRYVRPYLNRGRWWERAAERIPLLGRAYSRTLGRRTPPRGLPLAKVVEAGVAEDFGAAVLGRLPFGHRWRRQAAHALQQASERLVAQKAGQLAQHADTVLASYGTGRYAFEAMRRSGGRSVLSYPIAHNRYQQQLYAEEAALAPAFAAALPRLQDLSADYSERLDIECELADTILVGSSFVLRSFVAVGYDAARIVVTPYGVDTDRFVPRAVPRADRTFRVLFVGQVGQRKGMSYLLQAYEQFRRPDS
ncbi:MAG: hypothetical protein JO005_00625, partial [Gammaproteobacteria bacterium]|nr:hypothetical protein [Gammaproteobacteria bacterium]